MIAVIKLKKAAIASKNTTHGIDSMNTKDFTTINGHSLALEESLGYLKKAGKLQPFLLEIAQQYLLQKEIENIPEPTNAEIDQVSMEVRLQQQLIDADKFQQWLTVNKTTYDEFRSQIIYRLKLEKLKIKIAAPKLQTTFEEQKPQLDRAVLSRIVVNTPELAQTLKNKLEDGADFTQLAKQYSVVDDAVIGGVMGPVPYGTMPPIIRENVIDGQPGKIIGPVQIEQRYCLLKVEKILPATLDDALKKQLETQIFEQWLAEKLKSTNIELNVDL